jgi:hypothetical protein
MYMADLEKREGPVRGIGPSRHEGPPGRERGVRALSRALKQQLKLNEDRNLLSARVEESLGLDTTFLAAL